MRSSSVSKQVPTTSPDQKFRREVRRLSANFLSQRISHAQFISSVRVAAVAAGILECRRTTQDERMLKAIAWGKGTVEPGRLHTLLEPLFRQLEAGELQRDLYAQQVRRLLDQIKAPSRQLLPRTARGGPVGPSRTDPLVRSSRHGTAG